MEKWNLETQINKLNIVILKFKFAYAIMPVGKRNKAFHQERKKPQSGNLWGFSSPNLKREGLTPQAGYRLFVTIQPFDDVVAGYTSRDSDNKRNKAIQKEHPLSLPV